jgi:hypothetical protein
MQIKQLAVAAALLGLAAFTVHAAELRTVNYVNGRAGMQTVVRPEVMRPTIALSKQGRGVGNQSDASRAPKVQWHNPSRQLVGTPAPADRN